MLQVHSIETFSAHDGPGTRSVIFTQGCNFRCLYCHNPDTLPLQNPHATSMSTREILNLIKRYHPFYTNDGGVTISGGEPTLQAQELIPLFAAVKKLGLHTALDTNGSILTPDVKKLYQVTDLVIFDLKHLDSVAHQKLTGQDNITILETIKFRETQGKDFWLRLVLVPGYTNQTEHLHAWGQAFTNFKHLTRVEILPYHTYALEKYERLGLPYSLANVPAATPAQVATAEKILQTYFGAKLALN